MVLAAESLETLDSIDEKFVAQPPANVERILPVPHDGSLYDVFLDDTFGWYGVDADGEIICVVTCPYVANEIILGVIPIKCDDSWYWHVVFYAHNAHMIRI